MGRVLLAAAGDGSELSKQLAEMVEAQREEGRLLRRALADLAERSTDQARELRTMQKQLASTLRGDSRPRVSYTDDASFNAGSSMAA